MKKKELFAGIIIGSLLTATGTFAVQYVATDNPFPVKVNGNNATLEAYNIEGRTYFKLRDIADAVGGFNVDFKDDTICIDSDNTSPEVTVNPFAMTAENDHNAKYTSMSISNSITYNDKIYIPLDEIARAMDLRIYQDNQTKNIHLSSKLYFKTDLFATIGTSTTIYPVVLYQPAENINDTTGMKRYINMDALTNAGYDVEIFNDNGDTIWDFYVPQSPSSSYQGSSNYPSSNYPSSSKNDYEEMNRAAYESELAAINAKYDAMIDAVRSSYQSGTASSIGSTAAAQQIQQYEQQRQTEIEILDAKYGY